MSNLKNYLKALPFFFGVAFLFCISNQIHLNIEKNNLIKLLSNIAVSNQSKYIARIGQHFKVCVYSQKKIANIISISKFFELIDNETRLNPALYYREALKQCPLDTLMYIWVHQGGTNFFIDHHSNLYSASSRAGIKSTLTPINNIFGSAITAAAEEHLPFIFLSINELNGKRSQVKEKLAQNIAQQEIFQSLMNAKDIIVDGRPKSIIEESGKIIAKNDQEFASDKYWQDYFNANVSNMCILDIMLMLTIHSEHSLSFGTFLEYQNYVDVNFENIKSKAYFIYNSDKYSSLFQTRC